MIFNKKLFILASFLFALNSLQLYSQDATIKVTSSVVLPGKVTPLLFGNFLDFLNNFINGSDGIWAQEITNRGFDFRDLYEAGISVHWSKDTNEVSGNEILLLDGGYNKNGRYFQRIVNPENESKQALYQKVYVYDTVGSNFYVYLRSDSLFGKVSVVFKDTITEKVYYSRELSGISLEWKKFEFQIPPITGTHKVKLMVLLEGKGTLDIDEISFMALHNIGGIKNEYYQIFSEWRPGILRYPGGFFADMPLVHWEETICDIDQRRSPLSLGGTYHPPFDDQRMDFGVNEFLRFSSSIGAEPHFVVNMLNGTPKEAANWLEYCNSSKETKYGAMRDSSGFKKPINVKYWEIGNEQWDNPPQMAKDYLSFYDSMKSIDPTINCMVDGNIWGGKQYFDDVFDVIGNKCQFYSYHDLTPADPRSDQKYTNEQRYYSILGASKIFDNFFINTRKWFIERNIFPQTKLALTEFFINYGINPANWIDTNSKNVSLEAGLWMATVMNSFMRNTDILQIFEKTFGLGDIRVGYNIKGERIFYPSPIHSIMSLFRLHSGEYVLPVEIECKTFSTPFIYGLYNAENVTFIDATITASKDKLFISVVNKHISDSIICNFSFPFNIYGIDSKVFELVGDNIAITNSPDFPDRIKIKESTRRFTSTYRFPPHSFTLFEVPIQLDLDVEGQQILSNDITAFPNPANDILEFKLPNDIGLKFRISIYNSIGMLIFSDEIEGYKTEITIPVSSFYPGIYNVILNSGGKIHKASFCKIH